MIRLACGKEGAVKGPLGFWLGQNMVISAIREEARRGGGTDLREKMMSAVSTC